MVATNQRYYAYGRTRYGNIVVTDQRFTGQKQDATGLQYFNARYYDPEIGQFISPDTLVPDPGNLFDYNRYLYTRGNPMRYTDPSGHQSCMAMAPAMPLVLGCQAGELAMRYGPTIMQLAVQWADKLPAVGDWLFSSNTADQGTHSAGQQNAGNSASDNPDPNDPNESTKAASNNGSLNIIGNAKDYSTSELRAAQHMADLGNEVVLRPAANIQNVRTSDLLVNGNPYDVYTPITSNASRIISAIASKGSQASGIVLDLSQSSVKLQDLGNRLVPL